MEGIPSRWPRPIWRAPWKNYRVISGHLGWVQSVAIDPSNTWFCTGSADRTIKHKPGMYTIWFNPDYSRSQHFPTNFHHMGFSKWALETHTYTGHSGQVRGLTVSSTSPYMFSAGDDNSVKCWDLEQNKVIRSYHGHLNGVYCLAVHPTIDILLPGGRDSVCRVWDVRSKTEILALSGHKNTVCSLFARPTDPQVITGSHDSTIKFWDIRYGKTMATHTHHKKSVRAMAPYPKEDCFVSASTSDIKKFQLPRGEFMHNMLAQQNTIVNAAAVNEEGVLTTAGSLDSEAAIYAITYDQTGSRLIPCEADKTIKMWKEDETATPETHPVQFKPCKDITRF